MSHTEGLHKGMVIRHEGQLFTVLDYQQIQKGKQKPTVHVKLRSVSTGHTGERTLDELGKIEEVPTEMREMQYIYADRSDRVFMDTESYEQFPLGEDVVGNGIHFLVEQELYRCLTIDGQLVSLQIPDVVVLEVLDTAPVQHAGGATNVHKEARLASGIEIQVPLFIKTGDKIRVRTDNREYVGKEH
ncbi:MAG: elongation factor P [Phycisphaerales bacterium]|nr:MAG: elongation factor P [Phycisphaerales bacterium]